MIYAVVQRAGSSLQVGRAEIVQEAGTCEASMLGTIQPTCLALLAIGSR
jgi:hypothetical protein